jgi:dihydroxyacid dehydratase/phosphogluconate dehydratase
MVDERRNLRSTAWFGGSGKNAFMHRSWMKNEGHPPDVFDGRPVIGICNTWSERACEARRL